MSEYQHYEFQAIDRPLTPDEQAEVGSLSSRTRPSLTSATFTYSYSSFPGDPLDVLAAYYDVLLYMANWGGRRLAFRLAFRLPRALVPPEPLAPYGLRHWIDTTDRGDHLLLDLNLGGDAMDGGDWAVPAHAPRPLR